ncbi:hypothetical protein ACVW1B_004869 [Bradyrhizobium sp. USDA 4502]
MSINERMAPASYAGAMHRSTNAERQVSRAW